MEVNAKFLAWKQLPSFAKNVGFFSVAQLISLLLIFRKIRFYPIGPKLILINKQLLNYNAFLSIITTILVIILCKSPWEVQNWRGIICNTLNSSNIKRYLQQIFSILSLIYLRNRWDILCHSKYSTSEFFPVDSASKRRYF